MADQSLYGDVPFTLAAPASIVKVTVTGHQGYSGITGNDPWSLKVYIDGTYVNGVGGAGIGDETPILVAIAKNLGAGNHTVTVTWSGSQYITLSNDVTTVEWTYK